MKIILLFSGIMFLTIIYAEAQGINGFQYVNPLPNSQYAAPQSKIILRQGKLIDKSSISNDLIKVTGSLSGYHPGTILLANDHKTLIFTPAAYFLANENISVTLYAGLRTQNGNVIGGFNYSFRTCNSSVYTYPEISTNKIIQNKIKPHALSSVFDSTIPPDLTPYILNQSVNPSPGYVFLCPPPYLLIVDNQGTPVFYRNVEGTIYDFDLQPNGFLTYFIYPVNCYGLDSSLNLVSTYNTTGGFSPDVHELKVLPNGNYYIFGKRNVTMDLSKYGGITNADIIDGDLEEFDSTGNLIFEWDALAHYKITDVDGNDPNTDLTQGTIDFSHFNSFTTDTDGCLLISARDLDEITKVDPNTGNILWRLGGKNNQFTFINDNIGFSRQHDVRRFSNGDLSLFDNGTFESPQISSAVEYKLDEINKTATLVRRIYHDGIFTDTEGSVEELPNGNRFISWGHNWNPAVDEISANDSITFALSYLEYVDTYRSFKYNWQTNLFTTNVDTLNFGNIPADSSSSKTFTVYNPHNTPVTINQLYCPDYSFTSPSNFPFTIQPYDSISITVVFNPIDQNSHLSSFNIRNISYYSGSQQMIARQVVLIGSSNNTTLINRNDILPGQFLLGQNYPNPFNPSTTISYSIPKSGFVSITVFDVLGRKVETLVNEEKLPGNYKTIFNSDNLASGVYFYKLESGDFISIKKMLLIK